LLELSDGTVLSLVDATIKRWRLDRQDQPPQCIKSWETIGGDVNELVDLQDGTFGLSFKVVSFSAGVQVWNEMAIWDLGTGKQLSDLGFCGDTTSVVLGKGLLVGVEKQGFYSAGFGSLVLMDPKRDEKFSAIPLSDEHPHVYAYSREHSKLFILYERYDSSGQYRSKLEIRRVWNE